MTHSALDSQSLLRSSRRMLWIVWLAFLVEPTIYVFVSLFLIPESVKRPGRGEADLLVWIVYGGAALLFVASLILRRFLLSDQRLQVAIVRAARSSDLAAVDDVPPSSLRVQLIGIYRTALVIGWGLRSTMPIGGLLLLLLGGDQNPVIVLSGLAFVSNLLSYPKPDEFFERVNAVRDLSLWSGAT